MAVVATKMNASDLDQASTGGASRRDSMKDNRTLSEKFVDLVDEQVYRDESSEDDFPSVHQRGRLQRQPHNDRSQSELFLLIDNKASKGNDDDVPLSPKKNKNSYHRERRERSTAELKLLIDTEASRMKMEQKEIVKAKNSRLHRDRSPTEVEFLKECKTRQTTGENDKSGRPERSQSDSQLTLPDCSDEKDMRSSLPSKMSRESAASLSGNTGGEDEEAFQSAIDDQVQQALTDQHEAPVGGRRLYKERSQHELKLLENSRHKREKHVIAST